MSGADPLSPLSASASPCLALFLAVAALGTLSVRDRDERRRRQDGRPRDADPDQDNPRSPASHEKNGDRRIDDDACDRFIHSRRIRPRLSFSGIGSLAHAAPHDHFQKNGGGSSPNVRRLPALQSQKKRHEEGDRRDRHGDDDAGHRRLAEPGAEEDGAIAAPPPIGHSYYYKQTSHASHFETHLYDSAAGGRGDQRAHTARLAYLQQSNLGRRSGGGGGNGASFRIYGGDEMDDDEAEGDGGILTAAGARATVRGAAAAGSGGGETQQNAVSWSQDGGAATKEGEDKVAGQGELGSPDSEAESAAWGIGSLFRHLGGGAAANGGAEAGESIGGGASDTEAGDISDAMCGSSSQLPPMTPSTSLPGMAPRHNSVPDGLSTSTTMTPTSLRRGSTIDVASATRTPTLAASARLEAARSDYNARIMPAKVIMVRHGQSEGNVTENLYATKPDNAMRLTRLGWDQARNAGRILREKVLTKDGPTGTVHFIVSPYVRTVETFHGMASAWCDPAEFDHIANERQRIKAWYGRLVEMGLTWHEDPRIREQDFGNYQDPETIQKCKRERHRFGAFYYRFPHGESASDVFDRVSTFLDSLWRSFDLQKAQNYVLITHGISIRVLLARYFRYSIDQFNMLANPKNCEMIMLGHDGVGKLRLDGRCELKLQTDGNEEDTGGDVREPEASYPRVVGYQFHDRLRILPKKYIEKRTIRLAYDGK